MFWATMFLKLRFEIECLETCLWCRMFQKWSGRGESRLVQEWVPGGGWGRGCWCGWVCGHWSSTDWWWGRPPTPTDSPRTCARAEPALMPQHPPRAGRERAAGRPARFPPRHLPLPARAAWSANGWAYRLTACKLAMKLCRQNDRIFR